MKESEETIPKQSGVASLVTLFMAGDVMTGRVAGFQGSKGRRGGGYPSPEQESEGIPGNCLISECPLCKTEGSVMSESKQMAVVIPAGRARLQGILSLPQKPPRGVVVFALGSGSGRFSPRNQACFRIPFYKIPCFEVGCSHYAPRKYPSYRCAYWHPVWATP